MGWLIQVAVFTTVWHFLLKMHKYIEHVTIPGVPFLLVLAAIWNLFTLDLAMALGLLIIAAIYGFLAMVYYWCR